jgi:hypothetical protein
MANDGIGLAARLFQLELALYLRECGCGPKLHYLCARLRPRSPKRPRDLRQEYPRDTRISGAGERGQIGKQPVMRASALLGILGPMTHNTSLASLLKPLSIFPFERSLL